MITIPLLSQQDLTIYAGKKVVILGASQVSYHLCDIFEHHKIEVLGFCSDFKRHRFRHYQKLGVMTWSQLERLSQKYSNIIVQGGEFDPNTIKKAHEKANSLGIEYANFTAGQLLTSFIPQTICQLLQTPCGFRREYKQWMKSCEKRINFNIIWQVFNLRKSYLPVIICSPMKTADYTLHNTFDCHHIEYINVYHKPRCINHSLCEMKSKRLKIITAIREPISQNISTMYQNLSGGNKYLDWILGDLIQSGSADRETILACYHTLFSQQSLDVQALWEAYIKRYIYQEGSGNVRTDIARPVQQFLSEFKTHVLDILSYPFDKEVGYVIIKKGNIEVFVYQLEKLNSIVPQLSEWVGVPFDKLEKGNVGEDKWIGESYKQVQQEIEITQEYFDRCFSEPYVKHFYSEADIEKFKEKWRWHIKNEYATESRPK